MMNVRCHCCCPTLGYDLFVWSTVLGHSPSACCSGTVSLSNLVFDITQISSCRVVFSGNSDTCFKAINFAAGDWPAVKTYVENGGRLYIVAEHSGDYVSPGNPPHETTGCLVDMAGLNSFMAAMGSTMRYAGGDYVLTTDTTDGTTLADPGDANIAQGVTFNTNRFGEITGGTSVWKGTTVYYTDDRTVVGSEKVIVAVEKIGNGFIFLCGDSNMINLTPNYCDFIKRLWEYDDASII